jgi:hypothetical protein
MMTTSASSAEGLRSSSGVKVFELLLVFGEDAGLHPTFVHECDPGSQRKTSRDFVSCGLRIAISEDFRALFPKSGVGVK